MTTTVNDPAATAATDNKYVPAVVAPDLIASTGTSYAETVEFVTTNATSTPAARAALFIVIVPQGVFAVTPVDLLVACVTAVGTAVELPVLYPNCPLVEFTNDKFEPTMS